MSLASLLRRQTLRARFLAIMATVGLSLGLLGIWGVFDSQRTVQRTGELFDRSHEAAEAAATLREAIGGVRRLQASIIAVGASNTNEVERLAGLWKAEVQAVRQAAAAMQRSDAERAAAVKDLNTRLDEYLAALGPIVQQLQDARIDGAAALAYAERAEETVEALLKSAAAIRQAALAQQAALRDEGLAATTAAAQQRLAVVVVAMLLVLPLLALTLRSVQQPLDAALQVADRIAAGDLSRDLETDAASDELAALSRALQRMQVSLRGLVAQVRDTAQSIRVASTEVAGGNLDLSRRTEQAAGQLQATSQSMSQLHQVVSQSAEAATQADRLAAEARTVAERGGEVVARVVATMDEINDSSRRIADIIGTIDGIAFQTNILALNAAVEAARAGEQGRGFAVVAGEVRSLAQRSAGAAREIKGLIGTSVERVDGGARLVGDAGRTMQEIVVSVGRVSGIIGEISQSARDQSGGLGQVHQAVSELDHMTQQNAALVEQGAAAASSLQQQAERLTEVVAAFRLEPAHA